MYFSLSSFLRIEATIFSPLFLRDFSILAKESIRKNIDIKSISTRSKMSIYKRLSEALFIEYFVGT